MKTPEYIILTPTAPFKLYSLERFLKNIITFQPKPKEMVFCTEPEMVPHISKWEKELKKQGIKLVVFTLEPEILDKFPAQNIKKITYSRNHLKQYFIDSSYEWALWLDADIIPESNLARVLLRVAISEKSLVVSNLYYSRGSDKVVINGIGCTLAHREACRFAKFLNIPFFWNKKEVVDYLIDDFWFFAMLSAGDWHIKKQIGWNIKAKFGRFVSVRHIAEEGHVSFLKKLKKDTAYK